MCIACKLCRTVQTLHYILQWDNTRYFGKMILIERLTPVFLLFILFHLSAAGIYETFHAKENEFFQLVQDPETGDVYIGGRNTIYHLDSKLKLKRNITVGPSEDSQQCFPNRKECPSKSLRNNSIVVLEIEPFSRYLFACGTINQGACIKYDLADIKNSVRFYANKAENFVGSDTSTIAFFSPNPISNTSTLYVAISYDGRTFNAFPKTISERVITKAKNGFYNLAYRKSYLGIPTNEEIANIHPMKYIYGFKHNNFIYYISTHGSQTYIIRVCEYSEFYYYVQIPLKCWYDNHIWAQATGAKFIHGDKLLVTYWKELSNESLFCNHSMIEIQDKIKETISNCYTRRSKTVPTIPSWIVKDKKCIETVRIFFLSMIYSPKSSSSLLLSSVLHHFAFIEFITR